MNIGKIIGVIVFVAATTAVFLWPHAAAPDAPEEILRPVRSFVVQRGDFMPELRFAGTVKAESSRTLCFKQTGRIESIPLNKGQFVKKGEKLAWLYSEDFKNRLEESTAAVERDRLSYKRIADAAKKNAVSQEEVSKAQAQLRQSEARYEMDRRALEETVLVAPFDGTVADVPASELDMVSASSPIVVLQDMSRIRIEAAVPETIAILQRRMQRCGSGATNGCNVSVVFDSCADRTYAARFFEYTAAADAHTQTYAATYVMDPVDDLFLLPGMSATVIVPAGSYRLKDADATAAETVDIPESAVGVDDAGRYFAWRLDRDGEVFVAHKVLLAKCLLKGETMRVGDGVKPGDRLATAGIAVLTEGRKVTLLKE